MSREQETTLKGNEGGRISRRRFIAGAGAAVPMAIGITVVKPQLVRGTSANSKVRLGMLGCGGRGTWIGELFKQHGGYELVAAADYFQDKVDTFGEKLAVAAGHRYTGLSGYRRLLEQKGLDAVAIESPPYFHPEQAAAAVDAGLHVYIAKPIAVDVPGCHSIANSGKKATTKKRCFLVDFQTRANEFFREAIRRVHDGALGDFAFGESTYHASNPWGEHEPALAQDPTNPERRLRAWGLDRALSGDIITEQNIHTIDVASWIMNQEPVWAAGTGGRKVRQHKGSCWDHFAVLFQYPNKVGITFSSRQFKGHGTREGIRNRMFGSKGVLETQYGGTVLIRGENFYRGGETQEIYTQGAVNNIAAFHDSICEGRFDNLSVQPSVRSNLMTILGRTAAYTGARVYWDKLAEKRRPPGAQSAGPEGLKVSRRNVTGPKTAVRTLMNDVRLWVRRSCVTTFITAVLLAGCGGDSTSGFAREKGRILLTGSDLSTWRAETGEWQVVGSAVMDTQDQSKIATLPGDGVIVNGPRGKTVDLLSKDQFGDIAAHVEFMIPKGSNSGVYFMGRYEIQVRDDWGETEPTYAGNECGGIYRRWDESRAPKGFEGRSPRVKAGRPPGEWQSFDVIFRAPRFDTEGRKVANARFERVVHNGVLVHEDIEVTGHTRAAAYKDEKPVGPLMLQGDHGPVAYRDIWIVLLDK